MKELQERGGKGRDNWDSAEIVRHVTDGRDRGSREKWGGNRSQIKDPTGEELHSAKRIFRLSQLPAQKDNCNLSGPFSLPFSVAKYKGNTNPPPLPKPALTEEEVARKSTAIIEEYLHINDLKVRECHFAKNTIWLCRFDLKWPLNWLFFPSLVLQEALQCVTELNSASLLYVFVRHGIESTLERRTVARERIGLLLYQLVKAGMMPKQQFYKG